MIPRAAGSGLPEPAITETVDGPVTAADRTYAFAEIRSIYRDVPRAVHSVRTHLAVQPHAADDRRAAADCSMLVDGALIICAGAVATTPRDAVDHLTSRLRHRVQALDHGAAAPARGT